MSLRSDDISAATEARHASIMPSRRRLLGRGVKAAPVLMTLTSGPVSAALCTTGSIFGSMRPSGKQATTNCAGRSADTWATTKRKDWPLDPDTPFSPLFSPALSGTDVTLKKVIDPANGFDTVARNVVAALLNASTAPPLTPASILSASAAKAIWTSYATKGYYEPTAGVRWTAAKIVDWIKTTYS